MKTDKKSAKSPMTQPPKVVPEINKKKKALSEQQQLEQQQKALPIYQQREKLIQAMHDNQILIVIGETGSGKSTQLTQYLAKAGFAAEGIICCTQPRRNAALTVAERVAKEFGCILGEEVGYKVRFDDCTTPDTIIKYMTDGMLLRECLLDQDLTKYSVVILDEAHERTKNTDILFMLVKSAMKRRPDLKLIATSATLDAEKFSKYFYDAPIISVTGRSFPVEIIMSDRDYDKSDDYTEAAISKVIEIHKSKTPGDILVFLTGQVEIDNACSELSKRMTRLGEDMSKIIIKPAYSAMPKRKQAEIFKPTPDGCRKVVIATNIAETSLTIDGIVFEIDSGKVKQKFYPCKEDSEIIMHSLKVVQTSQAAAIQRAGRAGRTGPGKCFRLYTEKTYEEMSTTTTPEIQRSHLASTVLQLKYMGFEDVSKCDFMDRPSVESLNLAVKHLRQLSAVTRKGNLSALGKRMAQFPIEPILARMLINSVLLECSAEMLTIVSMLSVPNVFFTSEEEKFRAAEAKAEFHQPDGDHLTLLEVYKSWKQRNFDAEWSWNSYLQQGSLEQAHNTRNQLIGIMEKQGLDVVSCGKNWEEVQLAVLRGYHMNVAIKLPGKEGKRRNCYRTLQGQVVHIHPSSALFHTQPEW